jgi:hypothetical protein
MTNNPHAEPWKDLEKPGERRARRREAERQRARDRMNAVDLSESTRRMHEAAQQRMLTGN